MAKRRKSGLRKVTRAAAPPRAVMSRSAKAAAPPGAVTACGGRDAGAPSAGMQRNMRVVIAAAFSAAAMTGGTEGAITAGGAGKFL